MSEELKAAFKNFDKDGSGTLDAAELKAVLSRGDTPLSDDDIAAIIKAADKNGDGVLNIEEFIAWCTSSEDAAAMVKTGNGEAKEEPPKEEAKKEEEPPKEEEKKGE